MSANLQLRDARHQAGLTQAELAQRVGLSKSRYAGIENGNMRQPPLERAMAIAAELSVGVDEVFSINVCECGCGEPTLNRLLPGHHARLAEFGNQLRAGRRARRARLGITEVKTCAGCGNKFTRSDVPNQRLAHWIIRRYCSHECFRPRVAERECARPGCSNTFKPSHSTDLRRRHCSLRCAGLHRFEEWNVPDGWIRQMPPRARQRWLGRIHGRRSGHLGGRPTVALTDEQLEEVGRLRARGWGRRAIASRLTVSERAVRNALDS